MAQEGDILTDLDLDAPAGGPVPNGADTAPSAGIISQYIRDLSVEAPNTPQCFGWNEQPQIDLQFNIGARPVDGQPQGELHEVELKLTATAKTGQGSLYLVDLAYCGLVGMRNLPDDQAHGFLYAEAPRILFPFVRRIIADATRDAGFQPLMLDPIDFTGLYLQQLDARAREQGDVPAPGEALPPLNEGQA